jgi:hypothetical protein
LGQSELKESPALVGDGMMMKIPTSLFPSVAAKIGADGNVTLEERHAQPGVKDTVWEGFKSRQQSLQSGGAQNLGPGGDQNVALGHPTELDNVTMTIVNNDGAGEGFNDPTAVAAVFGNPGTTIGAQRLNAFRAAAEYWGAILKSTVPIRVSATMDPLSCSPTFGTLGSAGPTDAFRDFTGAPLASTWYVKALANSRAGFDLNPNESDITARFNSIVGTSTCLTGLKWWYGIGAPAPSGYIDFYTTVQHEIGHGIGFLTFVDLGTGAKALGFDDAYERWLWDWNLGGWPGMSNAQRLASSVNTGQVIFWGTQATEAGRGFLSAGLNSGYPRVFAPNPVQFGSSISHFDTVVTPNELMEPILTPPPGPYEFLTSGALQDIGWKILANGIFDFGGIGTWTWNPTDGWFQPTASDPSNLEPFNGNFVGAYGSGTWLWNETTSSWSQLSTAIPTHMKACGNNLLWSSAAYGMWRWNASAGWAQLTSANPDTMECFGGDAVFESALGTWLYSFTTGWSEITTANPTGVLACGSKLAWWRAGDTWYYEAATGWHQITTAGPETTACYAGNLAWESPLGTWIYNFTTGWSEISAANPDQILAWGPNLVWASAAYGTWVWNGGWSQITASNPTHMAVLGADLLWSYPGGTWVWGGGGGGTGWTNITSAVPTQIVSSGQVK